MHALHGGLHGHDEVVGGGAAFDRYSPTTIIGVETSGDTAAVCHYLDPGDGSGIEAALAAAPGGNFVLRRGFIDLNAGAVVAPFAIPAGAIFQCSGGSVFGTVGTPGTYIQARSSGDQGVWALGNGAVLRDCAIGVPLPVAATAGSEAVVNATDCMYGQIHNVAVQFQGALDAIAAANLTLRCAFLTRTPIAKPLTFLGVDYRNCYAEAGDGWYLRDLGVFADDTVGFLNTNFAGGLVSMERGSQYDECSVYGLDVAFRVFQTRSVIRAMNSMFCTVGAHIRASECEVRGGQIVRGGGANPSGVRIEVFAGTLQRPIVQGVFIDGQAAGIGVEVVADVGLSIVKAHIHDNRILSCVTGVLLDPNAGTVDSTIMTGNDLINNTTPFSNLGDVNLVDVGNLL
jgi:hypothetical protein